MKAQAELEPRDYRAFRWYAYFRYTYSQWILPVVWLFLSYKTGKTVTQEAAFQHHWILVYLVSAAYVFILLFGIFLLFFLIHLLLPKRIKNIYGTHTWEILESTIKETNDQGTLETRFSGIRYIDLQAHVFLIQKNGVSMIIPKRAELSSEEFFSVLRSKIQANN